MYKIVLSKEQLDYIGSVLAMRPFGEVHSLIEDITRQCNEQHDQGDA